MIPSREDIARRLRIHRPGTSPEMLSEAIRVNRLYLEWDTQKPRLTSRHVGFFGPAGSGEDQPVITTPGSTFANQLDELQNRIRHTPGALVTKGGGYTAFRGSSVCRICGAANGSLEFRCMGWTWPQGLPHYVAHGYELPAEFVAMVHAELAV